MKVAFLVNDLQLSGGIGVVVSHARHLAEDHGIETSLVLVREQEDPHWHYEALGGARVVALPEALGELYDVAVATWWETTYALFRLHARRHAYFVQSLEDRFYGPGEADRLGAALTHDLPVAFVTEARWIAETLGELRPDAPCHYVRNGIDKDVFPVVEHVDVRREGPLRIVVEGDPRVWFKGVADAIAAAEAMREPHELTVVTPDHDALSGLGPVQRVVGPLSAREMSALYAESDVVLKLSRVEGMFGPPLEGFHRGATCVVTPVTGHEEYVEHGWNGLVADWDDPRGTARQLDLVARDRRLLHFLRSNAVATARGWPSSAQSSQFMAAALHAIVREPPPAGGAGASALVTDLRAGLEAHRGLLAERAELERHVWSLRAGALSRWVLRFRASRGGRIVLRPFRPLYRRWRDRTAR